MWCAWPLVSRGCGGVGRTPRAGEEDRGAPRWKSGPAGVRRQRGPRLVLSPPWERRRGGDARGGECGCASVGHGLRSEASVDPRMVRIQRVEEACQVGNPGPEAGRVQQRFSSPGAQGRRARTQARTASAPISIRGRRLPSECTAIPEPQGLLSQPLPHTPPRPSLILHTGPGMKILPLPKLLNYSPYS